MTGRKSEKRRTRAGRKFVIPRESLSIAKAAENQREAMDFSAGKENRSA
jgi:hypothetical protein